MNLLYEAYAPLFEVIYMGPASVTSLLWVLSRGPQKVFGISYEAYAPLFGVYIFPQN